MYFYEIVTRISYRVLWKRNSKIWIIKNRNSNETISDFHCASHCQKEHAAKISGNVNDRTKKMFHEMIFWKCQFLMISNGDKISLLRLLSKLFLMLHSEFSYVKPRSRRNTRGRHSVGTDKGTPFSGNFCKPLRLQEIVDREEFYPAVRTRQNLILTWLLSSKNWIAAVTSIEQSLDQETCVENLKGDW